MVARAWGEGGARRRGVGVFRVEKPLGWDTVMSSHPCGNPQQVQPSLWTEKHSKDESLGKMLKESEAERELPHTAKGTGSFGYGCKMGSNL